MAKSLTDMVVVKYEIDDSDPENDSEWLSNPFYAKRVRHNNIIAPWQRCIKSDSDGEKCTIKYVADGKRKRLSPYEIAKSVVPLHDEIRTIGTRVIARNRKPYLPCEIDKNKEVTLISSQNDDFYPGIIARDYSADDKYCVFFDDGVVGIIERQHIRCVEENTFEHAHLNARLYFKFYTSQIQYEIKATEQLKFTVELNGEGKMARVVKIDRILAQIHFEEDDRFEWIYLGSPRIPQIWRRYVVEKKLDNIIEFQTFTACRTADVIMVDSVEQQDDRYEDDATNMSESFFTMNKSNGRAAKEHSCGHDCVRYEDYVDLTKIALFRRPILCGWERTARYYRSPCGLNFYSLQDIDKYLVETGSKIRIDSFDLTKNVDPSNNCGPWAANMVKDIDITRGAEKLPITMSHEMTLSERAFNYITNYKFDYVDVELKSNLGRQGCECTDNCRDKSKCSCWKLTIQRKLNRAPQKDDLVKNKKVGYKNMKLSDVVSSGIVECGANCKCCKDKCVNRVVQHGLQHELELFKTENRGWGVRTKIDIPSGVFVCNYAGDVLESRDADKRTSTVYQFKVPTLRKEDNLDDGDELDVQPKPKRYKYPDQYEVVQLLINYFPPILGFNKSNYRENEPKHSKDDDSGYVIDAIDHGNIARFFNHCCDPNLFVQGVYVGDDVRFPEIAFFTQALIKAGEELTFDYRYDLNDEKPTACLCGSKNCRNRLT